jgi:hypothetical protein
MTLSHISEIRLQNQQIAYSKFRNVQDLVNWMGAIQAQDYNMAKWAIGTRLPNATEQIIEEAFRKGEIIRTHLLRPTWHIVSSTDIHWMLKLTAPHVKSLLRSRHRELELDDSTINKCKSIIENSLVGGNQLTREEICTQLQNTQISTKGQRAAHLMMICEMDGLICSGAPKGKNQTYALLEERAPKPTSLTREESLAKLAGKYFTSHGPATIQDFIWWSGLPVKDAKNALESIKPELISIETNQQTFWLSDPSLNFITNTKSIYLLPAFDEFIISYRDRSPSILADDHKKAISENGLFRPIIVEDGRVTGIWKKIQKKDHAIIETSYFSMDKHLNPKLPEYAAKLYGDFLNQKTEIVKTSSWNL